VHSTILIRYFVGASCAIWLSAGGLIGSAEKKPWKDLTVETGDIKTHYIEAGTGDRTLVLVPGLSMVAEVWREQVPYFSTRGYRVLALDPRSHGQTTKTEGGNTYFQQAADLNAFLQALGISRPVLVGWSAGVAVLLDYIQSAELRPEKLILVDGGPTLYRRDDLPFGLTMQQAREFLAGFEDDRNKAVDQYVRGLFKARQPEGLYRELVQGSLKTPSGTAIALFFDLFTGDRRPALPRISVPTLVVVREENRQLGEYMQSRISGARLEVIPEVGHALFLEKPQYFNQTVEHFLQEP